MKANSRKQMKNFTDNKITTKQMGDACEMLIAAELTLAGIPALKVPDNWPGYDIIAQKPDNATPLRISVKSRTYKSGAAYVSYYSSDVFDWLAIVILPSAQEEKRRFFLIPRNIADKCARQDSPTAKTASERYFSISEVPTVFAAFENNFNLKLDIAPPELVRRKNKKREK